jgi:hypothetical protein
MSPIATLTSPCLAAAAAVCAAPMLDEPEEFEVAIMLGRTGLLLPPVEAGGTGRRRRRSVEDADRALDHAAEVVREERVVPAGWAPLPSERSADDRYQNPSRLRPADGAAPALRGGDQPLEAGAAP